MIIMKKSLPRRTVLRGIGATVTLPFLEAMVPAYTAEAQTAASPVARFGAVYIPHGAIMDRFTPKTAGAGFELSPTLTPFEPMRDRISVISGLDGPPEPAGGGGHAIGPASWLSGVNPRVTQGADILGGTTIDQVIASHIGEDTPLSSLQVGTEDSSRFVGACEIFYSCSYVNTVSWRTPTMPLPVEINPRVVFEQMFGRSGTPAERLARIQEIAASSTRWPRARSACSGSSSDPAIAPGSATIWKTSAKSNGGSSARNRTPTRGSGCRRAGGRARRIEERVTLMFDMLAVALQADVTRVFTFMMFRDYSQQTYPHLGVPDPNHALSHHQNNPERMAKLARVNQYHYGLFASSSEAALDPRWAGSLLDDGAALRVRHGQLEPPHAYATPIARRRRRTPGRPSPAASRRDADWEPSHQSRRAVWRARASLRRYERTGRAVTRLRTGLRCRSVT